MKILFAALTALLISACAQGPGVACSAYFSRISGKDAYSIDLTELSGQPDWPFHAALLGKRIAPSCRSLHPRAGEFPVLAGKSRESWLLFISKETAKYKGEALEGVKGDLVFYDRHGNPVRRHDDAVKLLEFEGFSLFRSAEVSSAGVKTCDQEIEHFDHAENGDVVGVLSPPKRSARMAAPQPQWTGPAGSAASAATAPGVPQDDASPTNWKLPLSPAELLKQYPYAMDSIMKAAGYKRRRKHSKGSGWVDERLHNHGPWVVTAGAHCLARIVPLLDDGQSPIRDLNDDGNPEVVTTSEGTDCYGMTGTAFVLLTWTPQGWRKLAAAEGAPTFYPRQGSTWPDIEIARAGFCFPRLRWKGETYVQDGFSYKNKPCDEIEER